MKKILVLANNDVGLFKFRKELLERLLKNKFEVYISLPNGTYVTQLVDMGCVFVETSIDRRGTNPIRDIKLFFMYEKIMKEVKPDYVLTYTIKPNIYGGIVAARRKITYFPNVTGLGSAIENGGLLNKVILGLYRYAFGKAKKVFFQNDRNLAYFKENGIVKDNYRILPGSGVNLLKYSMLEYPKELNTKFAFIARIMKEKGAGEFLEATQILKRKYPCVEFHICGFCEEAYEEQLKKLQKQNIIEYHGMVGDVRTVLKDIHCVVLPSYHEGMSNVLLEAASSGRPVIASNVSGCKECFEDGHSGYAVEVKSTEDLVLKMEKFIQLLYEEKKQMGLHARKYVEQRFDRQQVIDAYMQELND